MDEKMLENTEVDNKIVETPEQSLENIDIQEITEESFDESKEMNESPKEIEKLSGKIEMTTDINDIFAYVLYQNHVSIVRSITVKNISEDKLIGIKVIIKSDSDFMETATEEIPEILPGEEVIIKNPEIRVHADYLGSFTEKNTNIVTATVIWGNYELAEGSEKVTILPFNQWPGMNYYPDLLASFITPNHNVIVELQNLASKWMEKWTGNPSLEGYQSGDRKRILTMAAAVYAAIQEKNITYTNPPASFEEYGQRIRLADEILETHFATCIDITLLYCSVIEAIGLNGLLVMKKGHIFPGVWMIDESFPEPWTDDPSGLQKRFAAGINEIIVFEATNMCSGETVDFDKACATAEKEIEDYEQFEFIIDVSRARKSGIYPLPLRIKNENGYTFEHMDRDEDEVTAAPLRDMSFVDITAEKAVVTKQLQWERKLLDLSLRNMLINMRMGSSVLPILINDLASLEDNLAEGIEYELLQRPAEWDIHEINIADGEFVNELGPYAELIDHELKHHRMHSWLTEAELNKLATKLYRTAKTSMEENGASTLYMTLGLLKWSDGYKTVKDHYAPIILMPVEIIRKPAGKGYVIRKRDDDAQINITLLEFLKQNYELEISGLNPVPADEHGIDVEKIFAIFRHAIMGQKNWNVIENSFIGNFSFSQFVMWNDIHSRPELLEKNKIVRALINGAVDWNLEEEAAADSDESYIPVSVDASQLKAINMAAADVSFVLHGPPGTGKSQTITAMIANAVAKGKKVLFVAEKRAALEVVQKRLTSLGIGDFCLELHSNKAVKKNVLEQLKRGLEIGKDVSRSDYVHKLGELAEAKKVLDDYAKSLHKERYCGYSVRELIDLYESTKENEVYLKLNRTNLVTLDKKKIEEQRHLLNSLISIGKVIGHPKNHIFNNVNQTEYSQRLRRTLEDALFELSDNLTRLEESATNLSKLADMKEPEKYEDLSELQDLAKCIIEYDDLPVELLNDNGIDENIEKVLIYLGNRDYINQKRYRMSKIWNPEFFKMDMSVFKKQYEEANKKVFGKKKAIASLIKNLNEYSPYEKKNLDILRSLNEVEKFQEEEKQFSYEQTVMGYKTVKYFEQFESREDFIEKQSIVVAKLNFIKHNDIKLKELKTKCNWQQYYDESEKYIKILEQTNVSNEAVNDLLVLDESESTNWIKDKYELIDNVRKNTSALKEWIGFRQIEEQCIEADLKEICTAYIKGLPHEQVEEVYFKNLYKALILNAVEEDNVLDVFNGTSFNERIEQYKQLEEEFVDITKREIYYQLAISLPGTNEETEINKQLAILRKAISSGGRGLSIRTLFDQIPDVLTRLCPCLLMSPISVSQYLSADNELFDVVIFDEASQLPTCKAVGVLARGKNAVVVGDPNQMPPTSFFAGNMIDEDNLDIEDLESILDDCLALGLNQTHLQWHYRSRHESLIAFSNQEYYENSMFTFPSVNDRERRVNLVKTDGVFDRGKGRINEAEGKAVVEEILRRFNSSELKNSTVGVVTFNICQQSYIEDLLQKEFRKNLEFDKWANEKEEPLFVKNLENVQGDERDVILFSVGFGPDENGKLSLNFGPLNKEGGWKRLNVAVSRARSEMLVFSSMTSDMIDLNRTKAKGVEGLKDFLDYAENGKLQSNVKTIKETGYEGIQKKICTELEKNGYTCQRNVGHSDFKVDIAVVDPYNEEEYLIGILLDGESYKKSTNTKDREIAQISVLEGLGWEITRIWTMDWWDNSEKEIARVLRLLGEQKELSRIKAETSEPKDSAAESDDSQEENKLVASKTESEETVKPRATRKKADTNEPIKNKTFDVHDRFKPLNKPGE